jgi:hypothetical protein
MDVTEPDGRESRESVVDDLNLLLRKAKLDHGAIYECVGVILVEVVFKMDELEDNQNDAANQYGGYVYYDKKSKRRHEVLEVEEKYDVGVVLVLVVHFLRIIDLRQQFGLVLAPDVFHPASVINVLVQRVESQALQQLQEAAVFKGKHP